MDSKLRARSTTNSDGGTSQEEKKQELILEPSQPLRFINSSELKWLIIIGLLLTTAIGTYRSFVIYSHASPGTPIHQLTRIPTASILSTNSIDLKRLPYFAKKSNFFNQKFVKLGWAWTTFAIWFHSLALASFYFGAASPPDHTTRQSRADQDRSHPSTHVPRILTLHLVATTLWIFLTQWFFGTSIIERILILSGAKCVPSLNHPSSLQSHPDQTSNVLESVYCESRWGKKLAGLDPLTLSTHRPYWSGGIDVSGHTFLLSFSIMVILSALQPSLRHLFKKDDSTPQIPTSYKAAIYVNLGLLGLWWWMLLMTSLYFHGPVEKFSGLALGTGSWLFVEAVVNKLLR